MGNPEQLSCVAPDVSVFRAASASEGQAGEYSIEIGIGTPRDGLGPHHIHEPSFHAGYRLFVRFKIGEFHRCASKALSLIKHMNRQVTRLAKHIRIALGDNFKRQANRLCCAPIGWATIGADADERFGAPAVNFASVACSRFILDAMVERGGQTFGLCIVGKLFGRKIRHGVVGFDGNHVHSVCAEYRGNVGFVPRFTKLRLKIDGAIGSDRLHHQNTIRVDRPTFAIVAMADLDGKRGRLPSISHELVRLQPEIMRSGGCCHQCQRELCKNKAHQDVPYGELYEIESTIDSNIILNIINAIYFYVKNRIKNINSIFNILFSTKFITLLFTTTIPVHAEVIEIDAFGSSIVYNGPTVVLDEGTRSSEIVVGTNPAKGATPVAHVDRVEQDYGLPKGLVHAVIHQESRGRPNAVSIKGALGLMQLMPGTAAELGVNPYDPEQNVRGGALYLRKQIDRFGSIPLALAAYNAGPGAVLRYGGIPPYRETQNYVSTIMRRWQPLQSSHTAAASKIVAPIVPAINENVFFIEVTEP
jgi:Transglycosylase SLT domain